MADYVVKETCPCGAKFEVSGGFWTSLADALERFRKNHADCLKPRSEGLVAPRT